MNLHQPYDFEMRIIHLIKYITYIVFIYKYIYIYIRYINIYIYIYIYKYIYIYIAGHIKTYVTINICIYFIIF